MTKMRTRNRAAKQGGGAMTFVYDGAPAAKQVYLAGDFNAWDPASTRMLKRNGVFRKRVDLAPGQHEYKFVVDGEWKTDPKAAAQVANDVGTLNSVVCV
jgi:1,4-alpha-glucan branching enzyme